MAQYFEIAHGTKPLPYSDDFPWPFDIAICFEGVKHPIAFSEGVGHGAAGCVTSANEALESKWSEHFEVTNSAWIIPYIEKMASGEEIKQQEVLEHYERINGKKPESYVSKAS